MFTTCHVVSCEWQMSNDGFTLPPLATHHVASCDKIYETLYVPSIILFSSFFWVEIPSIILKLLQKVHSVIL